MSERIISQRFGDAWAELLRRLSSGGFTSRPRGMPIRELRDVVLTVYNGRHNILVCNDRRPNYRFMVAEWLWIWFGRSDVASISLYNPKIAAFSDDGVVFAGAYGPKIRGQWDRVVQQLRTDPDTRQAIIQIWDPAALNTKDVACTLALQFMLRDRLLHTSVYMRSSDIWLGLPYDFFTFSMLGNILASQLGVAPGEVTFHLGSSHLYETNFINAENVLGNQRWTTFTSPVLRDTPHPQLEQALEQTMHRPVEGKPWVCYENALRVFTQSDALTWLEEANVTPI